MTEGQQTGTERLVREGTSTKGNGRASRTHYLGFCEHETEGKFSSISSILNEHVMRERNVPPTACWRSSGLSELEFLTQSRCSWSDPPQAALLKERSPKTGPTMC